MTRSITISILAAAALLPASAQVNKEITVEREVVPVLREVSALAFTPEVALPPVEKPTLDYNRRTITARIPALFSFLEPAAVADSIAASPYRGYAALGYFPTYNLGASAGYRAIASDLTTLDLWMQYTGSQYKTRFYGYDGADPDKKYRVAWHDAAIGLTLAQRIGAKGSLDLSTTYAFSRFNNPEYKLYYGGPYWQNINRYDIDARYTSKTNDLGYTVGLAYGLFSPVKGYGEERIFSDEKHPAISPVRENIVRLNGALFADIDDTQSYRLDLDATMLARSESGMPSTPYYGWIESLIPRDGKTMGLVTVTPSYRLARQKFIMDLGARIDLTMGEGKFFHIAPDVKLTWMPSQSFAVYGRAGGGEHLNTMGSLYAVDRFISPVFWYESSHVPVEAEAGFRFGPLRGASLTLSAAYAAANDWLMPMQPDEGVVAFSAFDMRGWQFKARADYSFRHIASISLTGTINPQKGMTTGYYTDLDRARYTFAADLTLHPLKPLDITVGYELRACRSMRWYNLFDNELWTEPLPSGYLSEDIRRMRNISDINIGASWSFTPQLTAFVRAENILGRHVSSFARIPSQGFHGLLGAAYKF